MCLCVSVEGGVPDFMTCCAVTTKSPNHVQIVSLKCLPLKKEKKKRGEKANMSEVVDPNELHHFLFVCEV